MNRLGDIGGLLKRKEEGQMMSAPDELQPTKDLLAGRFGQQEQRMTPAIQSQGAPAEVSPRQEAVRSLASVPQKTQQEIEDEKYGAGVVNEDYTAEDLQKDRAKGDKLLSDNMSGSLGKIGAAMGKAKPGKVAKQTWSTFKPEDAMAARRAALMEVIKGR